jgi:YD repeat-containing protein
MSGNTDDHKGNTVSFQADGTFVVKSAEGDSAVLSPQGLKVQLHDGEFLNTNAEGVPTSGHIVNDAGYTVDISTDEKGTMHLKNDQGDSADINKDGSGQMLGADGTVAKMDSEGNANMTTADGTKWVAKSDGSGFITAKDGTRIDLAKNGSVAVKDASGKTTTYTADQVGQMKAQAENAGQNAGGAGTLGGGN